MKKQHLTKQEKHAIKKARNNRRNARGKQWQIVE